MALCWVKARGVMVLEEYESAKARGAKIYAEVAGFGMSADAYHMTAPDVDGPKRSMLAALRNAGLNLDQIQYLNAHGTSTPLGMSTKPMPSSWLLVTVRRTWW